MRRAASTCRAVQCVARISAVLMLGALLAGCAFALAGYHGDTKEENAAPEPSAWPSEETQPADGPVQAAIPEAVQQTVREMPSPSPSAPVHQSGEALPASAPVEDDWFADAAFIGDSRTEGLLLYSGIRAGGGFAYRGLTVQSVRTDPVIASGGGKATAVEALSKGTYNKVYLMLGINELGWNGTETFRRQAARLIERIQADHPEAVLVIQSILPVSARQDAKGSYVNNQRIIAYNQVLRELAEQYGAVYLNVGEAVADENGYLRADWNFDGVHLNVAGCQAWLEYLRTHPVTEVAPEDLPAE